MKKEVYPVIMMPVEEGYAIRIPDFETFTEGSDMADAIDMARDAIGQYGIYLEDERREIPGPFSKEIALEEGEFQTLVDIDFSEYRRKNDTRTVRKNCTIPNYLSLEAEKAGLNFSKILCEALRAKLGVM